MQIGEEWLLVGARHAGLWSRSPTELAPILHLGSGGLLHAQSHRALCTTGGHWMNGSRGRNPRPQRRPPAAGRTTAMHRRRQNGAGNAHQNYERYVALAREAMSNGDRIEAENFYQHAEHYLRVMRDRTN